MMPKMIEFGSCDHQKTERSFAYCVGWLGARVRSPTATRFETPETNPNTEMPMPEIVTVNPGKRHVQL
jgi:hypothetical protein